MLSILSLALGAASGLSSLHSTQIKELIKEPRKYGGSWPLWFICLSPASTHADRKTRFLNWSGVISLFPTASAAFQGPDKFDYHDEVQLSEEPKAWKDVWMDLSRKWSRFNTTIIHSRKHCQKNPPQKLGFCKVWPLGSDNTTKPITCFQSKVPWHDFRERKTTVGHSEFIKVCFYFLKRGTIKKKKKDGPHSAVIQRQFTAWQSWDLQSQLICALLFWSLTQCRISGLFSQMGQINRVCVFIWNGKREGGSQNTERGEEEGKKGRGRGWMEESGRRRGNSTIRACCIDSDRGLKAKSKRFHSH